MLPVLVQTQIRVPPPRELPQNGGKKNAAHARKTVGDKNPPRLDVFAVPFRDLASRGTLRWVHLNCGGVPAKGYASSVTDLPDGVHGVKKLLPVIKTVHTAATLEKSVQDAVRDLVAYAQKHGEDDDGGGIHTLVLEMFGHAHPESFLRQVPAQVMLSNAVFALHVDIASWAAAAEMRALLKNYIHLHINHHASMVQGWQALLPTLEATPVVPPQVLWDFAENL